MYSKAIAAGMNLQELLNPGYVDDFRRNFKLALQGEKIKEERLLTYHHSEQIWWSISYIPVIDSIHQIIGVSFIAVNITETKLQQESIRRKNESLIKIAHMQAHEIRNPVVNILGLINLIKLEGHTHANEYLPLLEQAACNLDTAIKGIIEQTDTASSPSKNNNAERLNCL
jgi:signal transduction histidine kinase